MKIQHQTTTTTQMERFKYKVGDEVHHSGVKTIINGRKIASDKDDGRYTNNKPIYRLSGVDGWVRECYLLKL